MSEASFPLVQGQTVPLPVPPVKPPSAILYLPIAYYRGPAGEWWGWPGKIELFHTVEEARDALATLSRMWADRCIVEIKLPAEAPAPAVKGKCAAVPTSADEFAAHKEEGGAP